MYGQENVYYYVDDEDNVEIKVGQVVADACRPSHFTFGMFGFGCGTSVRTSNFVQMPKSNYIVWQTIFGGSNRYSDGFIWGETIDNKTGIITRFRDITDENVKYSKTNADVENETKYLVFSRFDYVHFMFHGVYQYDDMEIRDGKLMIYYKRVARSYKYKLPNNLKGSKKIIPKTFEVDKKWLP